jgi:peptide subunit release factor RF-3
VLLQPLASTGRDVAGVAIGAAVEVVRAADGVGERTAAVLSISQLAAGVPIRTLISARREDRK